MSNIIGATSLQSDHPGLRTTMMTAPVSLHRSAAFTSRPLPSRAFSLAPFRLARENGSRFGLVVCVCVCLFVCVCVCVCVCVAAFG